MSTVIGRHYLSKEIIEVEIHHGVFKSFTTMSSDSDSQLWIAPGLVDVQINGFAGVDFNSSAGDDTCWWRLCNQLFACGCTHFLLTLITNSREAYSELLNQWEPFRLKTPNQCLGYHFEGPFLNPQEGYRGVHNPAWMKPVDWDWIQEWLDWTHGALKVLTLAPEVNSTDVIRCMQRGQQQGIRFSIGHSALKGVALEKAVEAGASAWTHLGNGMPSRIDKFNNVLFHALNCDAIRCFLIPDGHHIPAYVFKVLSRVLGERLLLTTDAVSAAQAYPGSYSLGQLKLEVGKNAETHLAGSSKLAGSTLDPFSGVFKAATLAQLSWSCMWEAFSTRPAQWLGLKHGLEVGNEASFCLFHTDPAPELLACFHKGRKVYSRNDIDSL